MPQSTQKPPVVLVHGWGGSFDATYVQHGWRRRLEQTGRAVIGLDLRGHGTKPAVEDPAYYADLAGAAEAELPEGPLDVVGFSLGAKISLELACRRPDRFRRIVLGGLGDGYFVESAGVGLAEKLERGLTEEERVKLANIMDYLAEADINPRGLAAVLRRPHNPLANPEGLGRIRSTVLLINGDRDAIATPDTKLRAALRNPRYLQLPGVDHYTMPAQASFLEAATQFLNEA